MQSGETKEHTCGVKDRNKLKEKEGEKTKPKFQSVKFSTLYDNKQKNTKQKEGV
jgi:hypothetical protein